MKHLSLSVFFPCYNEEANVERTTLAALDACRKITDDFEVIIVDDGSRDRTGEIADRLAAEHPEVRAVHNRPNQGYGGALQAGFRAARKEWVFYTDGDGQFAFNEIPRLLPLLHRDGIVSASRLARPATVSTRSTSGLRRATASNAANAVPTFCTTQPTCIGSFPGGTSRFVIDWINCFSAPCG